MLSLMVALCCEHTSVVLSTLIDIDMMAAAKEADAPEQPEQPIHHCKPKDRGLTKIRKRGRRKSAPPNILFFHLISILPHYLARFNKPNLPLHVRRTFATQTYFYY